MAKRKTLLEIGDAYIQASWSHPQSNTDIIAIYRDVTPDNGKVDFVMDQPLRGPWSIHDPIANQTITDKSIAPDAYKECSALAMELFQDLNQLNLNQVKADWAKDLGTVYDL
jgi:hypothetical protein